MFTVERAFREWDLRAIGLIVEEQQESSVPFKITVIIFFSVGIRVRVNIDGSVAIINFLVLAEVPVEERCVENKNTLAIFTMWCYFFGASAKGRVVWVSFAAG